MPNLGVKSSAESVGLLSLGCARNLVDSEAALGGLIQAGYQYSKDIAKSDIAIINTCGFTEDAQRESIDSILELVELKKQGKIKSLVVMGCLSQRYGETISKEIQEADLVLGSDQFAKLPQHLQRLNSSQNAFQVNPRPTGLIDQFMPKEQLTPAHYAYIKISEGCINACSYCAIPRMKGRHRSRSIEDIVNEVVMRAKSGVLKEINLIGQDAAAYGYDWSGKYQLPRLLKSIAKEVPDIWMRLLYAHPAHVTDEMIEAMANLTNVCPYIDLPIEHSHPDMLVRMNRGVTRKAMDQVITKLRRSIPNIALRTAVIVGFPGETVAEFNDLLDYIQDIRFERLGAFTYSREEGTRAYKMSDQVPEDVKESRFRELMNTQSSIAKEWGQKQIGQIQDVLIDEKHDGERVYIGRTRYDAPEVDHQVIIDSEKKINIGSIQKVQITDAIEHDLMGALIK